MLDARLKAGHDSRVINNETCYKVGEIMLGPALICAALLCSSQLALAFSQQAKLFGTGAVGRAFQGRSVALNRHRVLRHPRAALLARVFRLRALFLGRQHS